MAKELKEMDIHSEPGTKVVFAFPDNGYDFEIELAKKHLVVGGVYTVLDTYVGDFKTLVALKEFPEVEFNSVLFAAYEED